MKLKASYSLAFLPLLTATENIFQAVRECTDDSDCYNGFFCEPASSWSPFASADQGNYCKCGNNYGGNWCQLDNNNLPCDRAENENICQNGSTDVVIGF